MIQNVEISQGAIRQSKALSLTVSSIEDRLLNLPYSGEHLVKDPKVENLQLPSIALQFYSLVYATGTVPCDNDLVEAYLSQEQHFSYVPSDKVEVNYLGSRTVVKLQSLIARILRTYPSLVRDLHFYLMAYESKLFDAVYYSVTNDFAKGVDLRVRHRQNWYDVALFLDTSRSIFFWQRKAKRHRRNNDRLINISLNPAEAQIVGPYMLYTHQHVQQLKHLID